MSENVHSCYTFSITFCIILDMCLRKEIKLKITYAYLLNNFFFQWLFLFNRLSDRQEVELC